METTWSFVVYHISKDRKNQQSTWTRLFCLVRKHIIFLHNDNNTTGWLPLVHKFNNQHESIISSSFDHETCSKTLTKTFQSTSLPEVEFCFHWSHAVKRKKLTDRVQYGGMANELGTSFPAERNNKKFFRAWCPLPVTHVKDHTSAGEDFACATWPIKLPGNNRPEA